MRKAMAMRRVLLIIPVMREELGILCGVFKVFGSIPGIRRALGITCGMWRALETDADVRKRLELVAECGERWVSSL